MTTNLRVIYVKTSTIDKFHRYNLGVKWCCLYIKCCLIGVLVRKFAENYTAKEERREMKFIEIGT